MPERPDAFQAALDAARIAFTGRAADAAARACIAGAFAALARPAALADRPGARLPVCEHWLPEILAPDSYAPELGRLVAAFAAVEPDLRWQRRKGPVPAAGPGFEDGHANALLTGPGGLEPRNDVWLGVSLLAPGIRYPDHDHPPEEVYLVLTPGEFLQDGGGWFEPGPGGSFYNRPGIRHAMRAGDAPLFAFWLLRAEGV